MEGIKEAAVCICVCCVLCGTLKMLVPSASFEKLIRLAIGAFLVCSVAMPVGKAIKNIRIPKITSAVIEENGKMEAAVTTFTSEMLDSMVSGQIESALQSENVKVKEISIRMDILQDGSISISQAQVTLSADDYSRRDDLLKTVYTRTGVYVKFITEEE